VYGGQEVELFNAIGKQLLAIIPANAKTGSSSLSVVRG